MSEQAQLARIPWFGARKFAAVLAADLEALRVRHAEAETHLRRFGAMDVLDLEAKKAELERELNLVRAQIAQDRASALAELDQLNAECVTVKSQIVAAEDLAMLQEAGVYHYRHPRRQG